jgi:acetyltransferase-like isoleucine patch superfamily enzyme
MDKNKQHEIASLRKTNRVFDNQKSNLRKYQEMVVGEKNMASLIKYELIITLFGWVPGALGIFLRKQFYPHLFKPKLKNVIFGKNIDIFKPDKMKIGKKCLIGDNCFLEAHKGGNIVISENVSLGRGTSIQCGFGSVEIGDNTAIGAYSGIIAMSTRVKLGNNVLVAAYSYIIGDAGYDLESLHEPMVSKPILSKGIVIEDDVWLGAGVYVLDGVTIGTGSVIGAGSVVTRDIPEYSIAVGSPAKVIKSRK